MSLLGVFRSGDVNPDQIEREIVIDAPVSRVWAALTQAEHIGAWFGDAGADIDPRPGGALVIRWREHGVFPTVIERFEPERVFAWRWAHAAGEQPRPGNSTLVEFTLTAEGNGTRLRVVESGFRALELTADERAKCVADNTQGWREELDELRAYLQPAV
jgi:uncharacterized protein YndB with AHSA1/START domain